MAPAISEGTGHALGGTDASAGVGRRPRRRRATHRGREGPPDRAAAAPGAPAAAPVAPATPPFTLGEADARRPGDQAQPTDHESAGAVGPRRAPRAAGDRAAVAPRA